MRKGYLFLRECEADNRFRWPSIGVGPLDDAGMTETAVPVSLNGYREIKYTTVELMKSLGELFGIIGDPFMLPERCGNEFSMLWRMGIELPDKPVRIRHDEIFLNLRQKGDASLYIAQYTAQYFAEDELIYKDSAPSLAALESRRASELGVVNLAAAIVGPTFATHRELAARGFVLPIDAWPAWVPPFTEIPLFPTEDGNGEEGSVEKVCCI